MRRGPPTLAPNCDWFIGSFVPDSAFARVEAVVAEEVVDRAAQLVGAALGDDVDVAAERASELRLRAGGDHLELLDRIDAVGDAAQARRIVVGRQPVDDEVVREVALAADRDGDAGHGGRFREQLRAGDVGRRHAGREQRQVEEVAAVHRQRRDFRFEDGRGDLAARRFDHRRFRGDGDVGFDAGQRERDRHFECRARRHGDLARRILEARQRDGRLRSRRSSGTGNRNRPWASVTVGGSDVGGRVVASTDGAGNGRAAVVDDAAADAADINGLLRGHRPASASASANANRKLTRENMKSSEQTAATEIGSDSACAES